MDEALHKRGEQSKLPPAVSLWSEEECRNFELGALTVFTRSFHFVGHFT